MKIELFDMDEFIEVNNLKEVTSPVLFERGGTPNPNGLVSNEIFGVNIKSRKETFAYIDLGGHFFHPHIYKIIKRIFRNIDTIVNGTAHYIISKDGSLVKDEEMGYTGIDFLYENWDKIKWKGNEGMSSERAKLISKSKKNEIFISKLIVIPAFYRDIHSSEKGGGEVPEIDQYYVNLIRMASLVKERDMFDFSFHGTNAHIQDTLVDAYDYFKNKLDKKNGLLRKYLLGKNVDFGVRTVISAPVFNQDRLEDNLVDFRHAAVPISQVIVLCYPFMVAWLRNFFEKEVIETKAIKFAKDLSDNNSDKLLEIKNPESYFNDSFIKNALDKYVSDPSSRYDLIPVPTYTNKNYYLIFNGIYSDYENRNTGSLRRFMTWTDLLYIAACDITKDKHIMVTRYPILNAYGIFIANIRVSSTLKTIKMEIDDKKYNWYPDIDINMPKEKVGYNFIDTCRFSNSYLTGLDGDYDGDQVTSKIIWTQDANDECERVINSKSNIITPGGKNIRPIDLEAIQTFYTLTKDVN